MKKYFVINASNCSAENLSAKQLLAAYQNHVMTPNGVEAEYQYNHDSGILFQWQNGQKFVYENDLSPDEALKSLVSLTIEQIENLEDTIRVFDDKKEALDFVDFSIECVLESDDPYIEQMKEVRNMLSNA